MEANDWSQVSAGDLGSDFEDIEDELGIGKDSKANDKDKEGPDIDPESLDFGFDLEDFAGLRQAIWNAGQENDEDFLNGEPSTGTNTKEEDLNDEDIQKIERMMVKLQAVRDTSAGLSEEQRKKVAAKAVAEVMKEL